MLVLKARFTKEYIPRPLSNLEPKFRRPHTVNEFPYPISRKRVDKGMLIYKQLCQHIHICISFRTIYFYTIEKRYQTFSGIPKWEHLMTTDNN